MSVGERFHAAAWEAGQLAGWASSPRLAVTRERLQLLLNPLTLPCFELVARGGAPCTPSPVHLARTQPPPLSPPHCSQPPPYTLAHTPLPGASTAAQPPAGRRTPRGPSPTWPWTWASWPAWPSWPSTPPRGGRGPSTGSRRAPCSGRCSWWAMTGELQGMGGGVNTVGGVWGSVWRWMWQGITAGSAVM